ncbi:MAG: pentapeptide repeat-containing protein [Bacteroidia bacterium]|nr:pentapeptide repeat-containing protein [Bacteroidia bacterium]
MTSTTKKSFWKEKTFWIALVVSAALIAIVVYIPVWHAENDHYKWGLIEQKEIPGQANEYRKTLIQIIGGVVLAIGLYINWRRIKAQEEAVIATQKSIRITEEGQITERYTKAIEQLGNPEMAIRIGGIYALERIAKDSPNDHWTIMEVLSAFIRYGGFRINEKIEDIKSSLDQMIGLTASLDSYKEMGFDSYQFIEAHLPNIAPGGKISPDIQAAFSVLGRRDIQHDPENSVIDLSNTNLNGAFINKGNFSNASFYRSTLEKAIFIETDLSFSIFSEANLTESSFILVNLKTTFFEDSNLDRITFTGCKELTIKQLLNSKNLSKFKYLDDDLIHGLKIARPEFFSNSEV